MQNPNPNRRTVDSILSKLKEMVENKIPVTAEEWLDGAFYLHTLKLDEDDKLLFLNTALAKKEVELLEKHGAANRAKVELRTTKEYEDYQRQKNKIESIKGLVMIAKRQGDIRKI